MRLLKAGDLCPCCGQPLPEGLPGEKLLYLNWLAEGIALKEALEGVGYEAEDSKEL